MKKKIQFALITSALLATSGCMMSAAKIKAIANDPASWEVHVTTPWGSAVYERQAPAKSAAADGHKSVKINLARVRRFRNHPDTFGLIHRTCSQARDIRGSGKSLTAFSAFAFIAVVMYQTPPPLGTCD